MQLSLFNFKLDEKLIAQSPLQKRDTSRLLILNKSNGDIRHSFFEEITSLLKSGDILVRNNTRVIPARLLGVKEITQAKVELLLLHQVKEDEWECLVGNARVVKIGTTINIGNGLIMAKCLEVKEEGIRIFKFIYEGHFYETLDKVGQIPLPPYIKETLIDSERYQTIYAKTKGSAASPTAGLHFTDELFAKIKALGVEILDITLHVGLGTFRPVSSEDILKHKMHEEFYEISIETANKLNTALKNEQRIIAVGTTTVRTLEANFQKYQKITPTKESTNIFIYPGFKFNVINGLITNFHLPKSTLLMLVSAFATTEYILNAYNEAIKKGYRFFSFGDSMVII